MLVRSKTTTRSQFTWPAAGSGERPLQRPVVGEDGDPRCLPIENRDSLISRHRDARDSAEFVVRITLHGADP
jgi:hypothetical protein